MDFLSGFVAGGLTGGLVTRLADYLIDLAKEREKRRTSEAAKKRQDAIDRTRLRVDASILEPGHAQFKTIFVKIQSLGVLPVTINYGDIAVHSGKYPQPVKLCQISRKEISAVHPIELRIEVKNGIFATMILGIGEAEIKLVSKLAYGEDGESYADEQFYNRRTGQFEYR